MKHHQKKHPIPNKPQLARRLIARGNTVVEPSLLTTLRQEGLIQHIAPDSCVSLLSLHHLRNLYLGGSYETCE